MLTIMGMMSTFYPFYKVCFLSVFIVSFLGTKKKHLVIYFFIGKHLLLYQKWVEKKILSTYIYLCVNMCVVTNASLADTEEIYFAYS